jgi:hypothetical protein
MFLDKCNIICYSTPNYQVVTDIFMESLRNVNIPNENISHKLEIVSDDLMSVTGFQSNLWYYCVTNKIKHLIETLKINKNKYTYFIFSDCDIRFVERNKNKWVNIEEFLQLTENDIYFMREHVSEDVNSGFFIMKNSSIDKVIDFFTEVYETMLSTDNSCMELGDQTIVNNIKNKINYGFIPNNNVIFGPFEFDVENALIHHAIGARDVSDKIEQINNVKNLII